MRLFSRRAPVNLEVSALQNALDWMTLSMHEAADKREATPMPDHIKPTIEASRRRVAKLINNKAQNKQHPKFELPRKSLI